MISAKTSLIDQMVVSGSNFLIFVLAARFLEAEEVAKYAYTFGFYMLIYMVANAWVYQNIMSTDRQSLDDGDVLYFAGLNSLLVVFSIPVLIFSFQLVVADDFFDVSWAEVTFVVLFVAITQMIDFERRVVYFVSHSFFSGPIIVSVSGFLLRVFGLFIIQPDSFESFMLTLIVFSAPGLSFSVRRFSIEVYSRELFSFARRQIIDGKWMSLNIPVNWIWGQAPVFIIGTCVGLQAAGIYAVVRSIANLANVAMEMIPTYVASRLSNLYTTGQLGAYRKYIVRSISFGVFVWLIGLIVVSLFGSQILVLIIGGQYESYKALLILFWVFNIFIFVIRMQFIHLRFVERTKVMPLANFLGVVMLLGSFFLWSQVREIEGMAWSMIIGGLTITIVQMLGSSLIKLSEKVNNC